MIKHQTIAQDMATQSQTIIVTAQQPGLLALLSPFELHSAAFIVSSDLLLRIPIPMLSSLDTDC